MQLINSLDDKMVVCKFLEIVKSKPYHIEISNSVDLDEVANYKPPRRDLRCLQKYLLSSGSSELIIFEINIALG